MADVTDTESKFLNELIKDCLIYRLTESEALEYIKVRFSENFIIVLQTQEGPCII